MVMKAVWKSAGRERPACSTPFPDLFELGPDHVRLSTDRYPPVGKLSRGLKGFGSVCRRINRNVIVEVDEAAVAMDELNLSGFAAVGVIDRLTVQ